MELLYAIFHKEISARIKVMKILMLKNHFSQKISQLVAIIGHIYNFSPKYIFS